MSKMLRNIIIMIALVVVAVGAILLTNNLGNDVGEVAVEPTKDPAQHIYVDYAIDDIVDITVQNKSGTYTLYRTQSANFGDDQEAGQEASGDLVWKLKGSENADLNQSDAGSLARYASYLYINEVITEDMSRLAEFGLKDYSAKVTANFEDGTTKVYYYGNQVPAESTSYYMYVEGVEKVFTISSTYQYYMTKSALDLHALPNIGLTAQDISEIRLERDGRVVFHTKPAEHNLGLIANDVVEPFRHMANGDTLVKARTEIENLSVSGVVDTKGNFKKYGLEEPWGKLTVTGSNGYTSVLAVGDEIDDIYTACAFEGDENIYKIYTRMLGIFQYNTYQMVDKYLAMLDIKNVDKVVLSGFGFDDVRLGIEKVLQKNAEGEPRLNSAGEQVFDNIFSINGKKLGEEANEQGTWYYQYLIVPMSNTLLMPEEFSIEGLEPAGSIVFYLSAEPGEYKVDFYEFNADFYVASINGQRFLHKVTDNEVKKIINATEKMLEGTIEKPY